MASQAYVNQITTAVTASSTTLPEGLNIISVKNIDGTDNITISFTQAITGSSEEKATLTPTEDTLDFSNLSKPVGSRIIYWDASANTPILEIIGYID